MQIYSVVFALSRQIETKKYAKTFNFVCAGNKDFVKYQAQGGVNPTPCVRPWGCLQDRFSNDLNTACASETKIRQAD